MNSRRAVALMLQHLAGIGVTHLPKVDRPAVQPTRRRQDSVPSVAETAASVPDTSSIPMRSSSATRQPASRTEQAVDRAPAMSSRTAVPPPEMRIPPMIDEGTDVVMPARHTLTTRLLETRFSSVAEKTDALCQLAGLVAKCTRCQELASTRKQTVFGVGRSNAKILFLGEAPGADEDAQGEPFVGRAGQLLNKIIEASQLKREDIYICNILRCRPPGNRTPLPQEAASCREYLDAQIHIVAPKFIMCWGTVAAQNLLGETRAIGKLRGQFFDYRGIRVLCTYHPSYLLRNPAAKTLVWQDMKLFMQEMGVEL